MGRWRYGLSSNASAGYGGTADAKGPESRWRYLKRDTIEHAGIHMCMPLSVFVPSVKKYVTDFSMRHVDGLPNEVTGKHMFPSKPTTTAALWKRVQESGYGWTVPRARVW
jgi:hypothetical protein